MADTTHVKGLDELARVLETLPAKLQKNVMRGAVRAGMKRVQPAAKNNIKSRSGLLAKGLKIYTRAKGMTVQSTLRATGPHAHIAHMLEFTGALPHLIKAKNKSLFLGGNFAQQVSHPGFKAKPFMRPALDANANAAVVEVGNYIKDRLQTKQGLDTSHILVEGDEP